MKTQAVLLISAALIVSACTDSSYVRLRDIESYIQERSDSALVALNMVDSASLRTRKQKALYSLLTVMAKDKNNESICDINEIQPAVDWYAKHDSEDHYAASLFYSGRIHYEAGEYPAAIISFQESRDEAGSTYWKAMSTAHISYTYNRCYNKEEELKYSLEALDLWKRYGDLYRIQQSCLTLATAYSNNGDNHKADSLLSILCLASPPFVHAFPQWAELKIKGDRPDYEEISGLFDTGIKNGSEMSVGNWYEYAYTLYRCGDKRMADSMINQLSSYGESIASCLWLGKIAEEEGNSELALKYERIEKRLTDTIVRQQLSQSLFKAQMEQYRLNSEISSQKRKNVIYFSIILSILLLGLVVAIFIFYRTRREHLEKEIERILGIAEESSEMLRQARLENKEVENKSKETEASLMELRRVYARLYQRQFSEIGHLFDYYRNDTNISRVAANRYLEKTSEIIREINQGAERQSEFEDRINRELDDIMLKLRLDFPEFKESDFLFLSYVIVGFDATTRAIILNETPNNMRVKKARLVKKILNSQSENVLLYSCFLHPDK